MKRNRGRLPVLVLALVLALVLVLAAPPFGSEARAVNLETACSLTVEPGGPEIADDVADAKVVLDLYKVADAKPIPGIDSYTYELLPDFSGLTIGDDMNSESWAQLAQEAAKLAVGSETILPRVVGASAGSQITGLDAGLYLVVARGADKGDDYTTTVKEDDGTEKLATVAESRTQVYTFLPDLISLPTKEPDENGVINTANPGEWIYNASAVLKPDQAPRLGSLEIVKGLDGFAVGRPATFVFEVEGRIDGKVVYSNVFSMNFTQAGTQHMTVDDIPIGAEVTVREVYSGASYTLVSENPQTAVIDADEIVSVEFVNTPTEGRDGGSVTNQFTYVDGKWQWQAIPDLA